MQKRTLVVFPKTAIRLSIDVPDADFPANQIFPVVPCVIAIKFISEIAKLSQYTLPGIYEIPAAGVNGFPEICEVLPVPISKIVKSAQIVTCLPIFV